VHLRKSNTEPIIRLYAEAGSREEAEHIAGDAMQAIERLINKM
jgi:phosphomannomutase